jgi:hypothetical protein
MDPRFIAATELSMGSTCRFWHVIVDDEQGRAVACASLTAITLDVTDFADPRLAGVLRRLPAALTPLRHLKVLMCGLPVSAGQTGLARVPGADAADVLSALDDAVSRLAKAHGIHGICYREFEADDLGWTAPLLELGYRRAPSLPMHLFPPSFPDFPHYCAALRSRYRKEINRSLRKRRQTGIEVSVLCDAAAILRAYTPDVHELYSQLVESSEIKVERLPIGFFQELARRFDGQLDLVTLSKGGRIVAFGWGLQAGPAYHLLFAGFDPVLNAASDLYFNLVYAALDRALGRKAAKVYVGQSADAFKARLGCRAQPLYAFLKGVGPVMTRLVRYGARFLMPPVPVVSKVNVFRDDAVEAGPVAMGAARV